MNFKELAENLVNDDDTYEIYDELSGIMSDAGLYQEQAGCYEKMWHLCKDNSLLIKVGDIFLKKLNNAKCALAAYSLYLQKDNPEFYENLIECTVKCGFHCFNFDNDLQFTDATLLSDKYTAIIYMLVYLSKRLEIPQILELEEYLDKISTQIIKINSTDTEDVKNSKIYASNLLVSLPLNFDINRFAIKLNPDNESAYLNIIDIYLNNNNFAELFEFYNKIYCVKFRKNIANKLSEIYLAYSDKLYAENNFFKSLQYQQIAINLELEDGACEAE